MKSTEVEIGISFIIHRETSGLSITCKMCNMKSYNENDIKNRYCGKCKTWHDDIKNKILNTDDI